MQVSKIQIKNMYADFLTRLENEKNTQTHFYYEDDDGRWGDLVPISPNVYVDYHREPPSGNVTDDNTGGVSR